MGLTWISKLQKFLGSGEGEIVVCRGKWLLSEHQRFLSNKQGNSWGILRMPSPARWMLCIPMDLFFADEEDKDGLQELGAEQKCFVEHILCTKPLPCR